MPIPKTPQEIIKILNDYDGDNIWGDLILTLDYDETATDAAYAAQDRNPAYDDIVVIGGVTYDHHGEQWRQMPDWLKGP